jgi:hypothetical protein
MKTISKIFRAWKNFAHKIARAQTWFLMFIIYFLIVPFFNILRFRDPLKLRLQKKAGSYWETKKKLDTSLEGMKLPF